MIILILNYTRMKNVDIRIVLNVKQQTLDIVKV